MGIWWLERLGQLTQNLFLSSCHFLVSGYPSSCFFMSFACVSAAQYKTQIALYLSLWNNYGNNVWNKSSYIFMHHVYLRTSTFQDNAILVGIYPSSHQFNHAQLESLFRFSFYGSMVEWDLTKWTKICCSLIPFYVSTFHFVMS